MCHCRVQDNVLVVADARTLSCARRQPDCDCYSSPARMLTMAAISTAVIYLSPFTLARPA